jgi:hypothetical protein
MEIFVDARAHELGELAARVADTRSELDRTRRELVSSWQRMDGQVAERQKALLDDLDDYASSIEAKVADLTRTLDMVASTQTPTTTR